MTNPSEPGSPPAADPSAISAGGTAREVFAAFLKLGCTAFGGPIAHLGYFQNEFVRRRRWLDEAAFADLVALCQFLPGPTSSQVGLAIGWRRAGWVGGFLAWLAFTLPSALLMVGFAGGIQFAGNLANAGWVQGLKVAAVAVVAQAVWLMAKRLCPDAPRATLATAAAVILLLAPGPWTQIAVLGAGALAGLLMARWFGLKSSPARSSAGLHRPLTGIGWLVIFLGLLGLLPWLAQTWPARWIQVFDGFYRTGSLVFGGGHVMLPLLEQTTVGRGWLDHDTFLAGYGAAQALPGPLFTFSAYLGWLMPLGGIAGALLALLAIYLPTALLVAGALPQWERLRTTPSARALLAGTNAVVVGLLGAAFYSPIWTSTITAPAHLALMLAAYAGLEGWRLPPWMIVLACALTGEFALK